LSYVSNTIIVRSLSLGLDKWGYRF